MYHCASAYDVAPGSGDAHDPGLHVVSSFPSLYTLLGIKGEDGIFSSRHATKPRGDKRDFQSEYVLLAESSDTEREPKGSGNGRSVST